MRYVIFMLFFAVSCAIGKDHVKSLTESMGQEVIEMGTPIKDLPPGLDEEPSAELDDDETTTVTVQPATKRESRKTSTILSSTTTQKKAETMKEDALSQEEEESRIEKELSEIYKDTDYKAEPNKIISKKPVEIKADKPIGRARTNFKFQPDVNDKADVERFRTSIDEISCDKRVTQRLSEVNKTVATSVAAKQVTSITAVASILLFVLVCQ